MNTRVLFLSFSALQTRDVGTRFFKTDLHFHTPASEDARGSNRYGFNPYNAKFPTKSKNSNYEQELAEIQDDILADAKTLANEIVQNFLQQELSIVAITDHNGIGTLWMDPESTEKSMDLAAPTWYEIIDDQAQLVNEAMGHTELLILPGVEISTTGVHILAIFPPQNPRRKIHFMICDLLNEVGFDPNDWGRNPKVGKASVEDTIELIRKKGGLPIPAHIDGSDQALLDLFDMTSGAMKNVLQSETLRAVEIVDPEKFSKVDKNLKMSTKAWIDEVRGKAGLPSLAYFQGSDAHDIPSIAKRLTYLKMTTPSFSGLDTAIKMPSSRVRIEASYKPFEGLSLHSMVFKHPFLGAQGIRFNPNLNCVTGRKGSGKTSLYTLIQSATDATLPQTDSDTILFVEQVRSNQPTSYYAFCRSVGSMAIEIFEIDPWNEKATSLNLSQTQNKALLPQFYDPVQAEELINDPGKLTNFLKSNYGEPTPENIKLFNEQFSTSRFLEEDEDPLLALRIEQGAYQLSVNVRWRRGKPDMQDFFMLHKSMRRTIMMAIGLMDNSFGPVIIDAPEDLFDNDDMMNVLVPIIREQKERRQILIFTSHPILAVNTDPDNYILLQTDGTQVKEITSGFAVDSQEMRPLLLNILEGSLGAVRKRANLYGII